MINYRRLSLMRTAGRVLRAHTIPLINRQTVGEHTFGVLNIMIAILGPKLLRENPHLLTMALYHDATEAILGDVPSTAKWKFGRLESALKEAEELITEEYGLEKVVPGTWSANILKFADYAELAMFGIEELKMGNHHVTTMVQNVLNAIDSRKLADITPEAKELHELIVRDFNRWRKHDEEPRGVSG